MKYTSRLANDCVAMVKHNNAMQSIFLISKMYAKIKTQDNKKYDTSEKKFFEFIWLRRLMGYARFNAFGVSMPSAFIATLFQWANARFCAFGVSTLRCFNG